MSWCTRSGASQTRKRRNLLIQTSDDFDSSGTFLKIKSKLLYVFQGAQRSPADTEKHAYLNCY